MDFKKNTGAVRFTLDIPTADHLKLKMLSVRRKKSMKEMILAAVSKIVKDVTMEDEE